MRLFDEIRTFFERNSDWLLRLWRSRKLNVPPALKLRRTSRAGPIAKPSACYGASKKQEFLFTPLESSYHKPFKSTLLAHFEKQLSNGVYPVGKRSFSFGARPRLPVRSRKAKEGFPPPPNFVPVKLARRLLLHLNYKFSRHYRFCKFICLTNIYPLWYTYRVVSKIK